MRGCKVTRRVVGLAAMGSIFLTAATLPVRAAEPAQASATGQKEKEAAWISLFNGRDLSGWVQRGGKAEYRVEDGAIVGKTVPDTPNSFLCTTRKFDNFILELEFKVDPKMNSGIQFRSEVFDARHTIEHNGKTINIPAGRVHGYQYEIDPSTRAWSGGVYDEGRRGWLVDLKDKPAAQKAFRQNEWNKVRIEARGDSIKTWLNGVPIADLKDTVTPSGFVALQVHTVGKNAAPMEIRWRNIRLWELPATPEPAR